MKTKQKRRRPKRKNGDITQIRGIRKKHGKEEGINSRQA